MSDKKRIQINLVIPTHFRDLLRKMAAKQNLKDPGQVVSGASIAAEILITALKEIQGKEGQNHDK